MTNAERFRQIFGFYATELWSLPERQFLKWLNDEVLETVPTLNRDILKQVYCLEDEHENS